MLFVILGNNLGSRLVSNDFILHFPPSYQRHCLGSEWQVDFLESALESIPSVLMNTWCSKEEDLANVFFLPCSGNSCVRQRRFLNCCLF